MRYTETANLMARGEYTEDELWRLPLGLHVGLGLLHQRARGKWREADEATTTALGDATARADSFETILMMTTTRLRRLEAENRRLTGENTELRHLARTYKTENVSLRKRVEGARSELSIMSAQLREAIQRIAQLRTAKSKPDLRQVA